MSAKIMLVLAVFASLGLSGPARANAFLYSNGIYTPLVGPGSFIITSADGINDIGQIVGDGTAGYVETNGNLSVVTFTPGGINNAGEIVGYCCGLATDGYLDVGGTLITFDYPGSSSVVTVITQPSGINNAGQIVGTAEGGISPRGFVYANGVFTTIQVPTGDPFTTTEANGINDAGQVVGSYTDNSGTHGFLDSNAVFQTIDFPGSSYTMLQGINDAGEIVGWYVGGSPLADHGFTYMNGVFSPIDVPFPNVNGTQTRAINDLGEIVGVYGVNTPPPPFTSPEPASIWLFSCGSAAILFQRKCLPAKISRCLKR